MDLARAQHGARIRAPPQQRLTGLEPGEDAVPVGIEQGGDRQVAARRQQAVGVVQGLLGGRKYRVLRIQKGQPQGRAVHRLSR